MVVFKRSICIYAFVKIYVKTSAPKKSSSFAVDTAATLPGRRDITGIWGFCVIFFTIVLTF